MSDMLDVEYRCLGCGMHWTKIAVRYRAKDEDVIEWMRAVQVAVGDDHVARVPICVFRKCDIKVPLPEGGRGIGQRVLS